VLSQVRLETRTPSAFHFWGEFSIDSARHGFGHGCTDFHRSEGTNPCIRVIIRVGLDASQSICPRFERHPSLLTLDSSRTLCYNVYQREDIGCCARSPTPNLDRQK
jgi:hypothetical protein